MPLEEQKANKYVLIPFLIALSSAIGLLAGYKMNLKNNDLALLKLEERNEETQLQGGTIEEILRFVENTYVDSIDQDVLKVDAINHILNQLDPHSSYITPEERNEHYEKMQGEYLGIGIETLKLRDTFYISNIKKDSPAEKSNLGIGDALLVMNGDTISGNDTSHEQMSEMLKDNSKVSISYRDLESKELKELSVSQDKVITHSVDHAYSINDETLYLKILRFNSNTYEQFLKTIEKFIKEDEPINLVIDLRNNRGGYLPEAINILSQLFLERDRLLTYTEGLNRKKAEYRTTGKPFFNIDKVAILQNGYSASASEIVAGAIQDWDRGFIVGEPSYGKGLVQEIFPLTNGGALRLTIAMYYTPSKRLIQKSYENIKKDFTADTTDFLTKVLNRKVTGGGGISPDYYVEDLNNEFCFNFFDYIDYYLMDMFQKNNAITLEPEQKTAENFIAFINREYEENTSELIENCKLNTELYIEAHLSRFKEGEKAYSKLLNASDPFVNQALDIFNTDKTTLALLSEKN